MQLLNVTAACPPELLEAVRSARSITDVLHPCRQLSYESGRSVTLSRCRVSGKQVVVKTQSRCDPDELQQVLSEAQIHACLTPSMHISQLLLAVQDSRQVVLVMEHAEGGNLREHMEDKRQLLDEQRLQQWVARPLLLALAALQAKGIVHRDVKPENVLIHNDELLLTDFGLAACVTPPCDDSSSSLDSSRCCSDDEAVSSAICGSPATIASLACSSASGSRASVRGRVSPGAAAATAPPLTACGTPMYTAPEVLLAMFRSQPLSGVVTPKNDVWSLGLMLMEAATGSHPFSADACAAAGGNVLYSIAHHKALAMPESISPEFKDFLSQALQRDPERRPSAQELLCHTWLNDGQDTTATTLVTKVVGVMAQASTEGDGYSPRHRDRAVSDCGRPARERLAMVSDALEVALVGPSMPRSLSNDVMLPAAAAVHAGMPCPPVACELQHAFSDVADVTSHLSIVSVSKPAKAAASVQVGSSPRPEAVSTPPVGLTAFEMAMSWED